MDWFIRVYHGTRYLALFGLEKFDVISNRIRYLISQKVGIAYVFSHYYAKLKVNSYGPLPVEKKLTLHDVITLIKSVLNKDKNHYYHIIFSKNVPIN